MAICTSAVLSSCNSEDLQEKVVNNSVESIVTNPYALDKEKALAETQAFFQDQAKEGGMKLRSEQLTTSECEVAVINVQTTIEDQSSAAKKVAQEIPIYTINYKDSEGNPIGFAVTIGDERVDDKVVIYNNEGNCDLTSDSDDEAAFWKERIAGYIYNSINVSELNELMKSEFKEDDITTYAGGVDVGDTVDPNATILLNIVNWRPMGSPFTNYNPYRSGARAAASSSTVAMASIMAYHKWPRRGAYQRYNSNNGVLTTITTNYPESAWNLISTSSIPTNSTARELISNLYAEIGYKLNTNFINSTSAKSNTNNVYKVFNQMGFESSQTTFRLTLVGQQIWRFNVPVFLAGYNREKNTEHAYVICGTSLKNYDPMKYYLKNGDGSWDGWYDYNLFYNYGSHGYDSSFPYRFDMKVVLCWSTDYYTTPNTGSTSLYKAENVNPY